MPIRPNWLVIISIVAIAYCLSFMMGMDYGVRESGILHIQESAIRK